MQIKAELNKVHRDSASMLKIIYFWINKFKRGRTCIWRRSMFRTSSWSYYIGYRKKMYNIGDRWVKVHEIAKVGISTEQVHNTLHEKSHMKKLCARWMPRWLSIKNVHKRMFQRGVWWSLNSICRIFDIDSWL